MLRLAPLLAPLLACLALACGQRPTLLINIQHPTLDPATVPGELEVQVLRAEDGSVVGQKAVSTGSLGSRQRLLEGLELVEGRRYRLRLAATLEGSACGSRRRQVGESPIFTYQRGTAEITVYLDCADASSPTAALSQDRMLHAAALVPHPEPFGRVLIVGGAAPGADVLLNPSGAGILDTVESYAVESGEFNVVPDRLGQAAVLPQATAIGDDEVLVTGGLAYGLGVFSGTKKVAAYASGSRDLRNDLEQARGGHAAVSLGSSRVAVIGGLAVLTKAPAAMALRSVETYDASTEGATTLSASVLSVSRILPAVIPLPDGQQVVVAGGAWSSEVDVPNELLCLSGTCSCGTPPCSSPLGGFGKGLGRAGVQGAFVPCGDGGGAVYLAGGGYTSDAQQRVSYDDIYCLDAGARSSKAPLEPVGHLKSPRNGHTVTLVRGPSGPRLFVAGGGTNPNDASTRTAELVPVSCTCAPIAGPIGEVALRGNRIWHTATLLPDGTVLLVGGFLRAPPERFNPDL